jgi:hypothetical protein
VKPKINFTPPPNHPDSYGSLQVVRELDDRLFILLPNGHYICVELLETGRTRALLKVVAHKSIPIIREESLKKAAHLAVNDWEPVAPSSNTVGDNYDDFRD